MNRRQRFGAKAEAEAVAYLERQGYRLVERNYRCRSGEVDAILTDDEIMVFLEVRARRGNMVGTPEESVTPTKADIWRTWRRPIWRRMDMLTCRGGSI